MTAMPDSQLAAPATRRDTAVGAAWAVIITLGGMQVTFNVASALNHSKLSPVPIAAGLGPVVGSVLLSHLSASRRAQTWFRCAVAAVMLCSMAVSIGATVEVTSPVFGSWWRAVLFGIVLDAASLLALWFIMDRHDAHSADAAAVQAAQAAVKQAESKLAAAESQARETAAAASARADQAADEAARTRTALDAATTELATVKAELQGLNRGLNKGRGSARKTARGSAPSSGRSSALNNAPGSGERDDLENKAEALRILDETEYKISGKELGMRLGGLSESYGCRLKRELSQFVADPEAGR